MSLKIHVHSPCWNEESFIRFYLDHYSFADKIWIYDNQSSDSTRSILSEYSNVEIVEYESRGEIRDDMYLEIKNTYWKTRSMDADWVIACDIDELLYHKNILAFLEGMKRNNVAVLKPVGYQMIGDYPEPGKKITEQITTGSRSIHYDKTVCFCPSKINEINFSPGCHYSQPDVKEGETVFHSDLKLLHYKYIGTLDRILNRALQYKKRLSKFNIQTGHGVQYIKHELLINEYNSLKNNLVQVL